MNTRIGPVTHIEYADIVQARDEITTLGMAMDLVYAKGRLTPAQIVLCRKIAEDNPGILMMARFANLGPVLYQSAG